jgi:metal iron transporter
LQPFLRRLITRLIGVIPAAAIAAAIGEKGLNTMLVASQVLLSIVLPTVIFPLVYLCSRKDIMTVDGPLEDCVVVAQVNPAEEGTRGNEASASAIPTLPTPMSPNLGCLTLSSPYPAGLSQALPIRSASSDMPLSDATQAHQSPAQRRRKSYVSPTWVTCLGYALFGVVVMANGYVIVQLGLGNG